MHTSKCAVMAAAARAPLARWLSCTVRLVRHSGRPLPHSPACTASCTTRSAVRLDVGFPGSPTMDLYSHVTKLGFWRFGPFSCPETALETTPRDAAEASRAPRYPGYSCSRPGRLPGNPQARVHADNKPARPATPNVTKAPPPALTYATMPRTHANTRKPVAITYTRHPMVATSVQTHTAAGGRFIRLGLIYVESIGLQSLCEPMASSGQSLVGTNCKTAT